MYCRPFAFWKHYYGLKKIVKFVSSHLSAGSHDSYISMDGIDFYCFLNFFGMTQGWESTVVLLRKAFHRDGMSCGLHEIV